MIGSQVGLFKIKTKTTLNTKRWIMIYYDQYEENVTTYTFYWPNATVSSKWKGCSALVQLEFKWISVFRPKIECLVIDLQGNARKYLRKCSSTIIHCTVCTESFAKHQKRLQLIEKGLFAFKTRDKNHSPSVSQHGKILQTKNAERETRPAIWKSPTSIKSCLGPGSWNS